MDIGELLQFKPDTGATKRNKRTAGSDEHISAGIESRRPKRIKLIHESETGGGNEDNVASGPGDDILAAVDINLEDVEGLDIFDEASLKKLILKFEKKVYKNQEMRIKFADNPEKFMESELELNEVINEMHVIATIPDLYHLLVDLRACTSLLTLLSHENTDISIAVVDLLQELTDIDTLNESEESAASLIDTLADEQLVSTLVQNLERLDETVKEESDCVHNTLAIVENMIEFKPEMCTEAAKQNALMWILKRLKAKIPFDGNKLYASEILAILLQNNNENRMLLGELDGIDTLLQQLAVYKRHDPSSDEEIELMENLFNCLCSALMLSDNRDRFLKGEGLQLMNLMLREKKMSRLSALKVLDHAMSNKDGADNCMKFVEILGLRTIFPLFMKTPKYCKKTGHAHVENEEHILSIISSLLKNCASQQRQRLINKFAENDLAKIDRLMELHRGYLEKVEQADRAIHTEKERLSRHGTDESSEDEFYIRRLDAGLFSLQLIDFIILELCCNSGLQTIKQKVIQDIALHGGSTKAIKLVMREYAGNLGDAVEKEVREIERQHILNMIDKF